MGNPKNYCLCSDIAGFHRHSAKQKTNNQNKTTTKHQTQDNKYYDYIHKNSKIYKNTIMMMK